MTDEAPKLTPIDMPPEMSGAKTIIGDILLQPPDGETGPGYKLVIPESDLWETPITPRECMLLSMMFFKAITNKSFQPLDFWEYIRRHKLERFFVKVEA